MQIMSPDTEPEFCHSTLVCMNDSKPFEYNSSSYDAAQPESTINANQNRIFSSLNGHEREADSLSIKMKDKDGYWNTPANELSVVVDDFTNTNEREAKDFVGVGTVPTDLSQKDSDLCTDKDVVECDLPELIVCYKDSTCHAIKDICVDEGVNAENVFLTGSVMDSHSSLPANEYRHTDMTKKVVNTDFLSQDGFRSSPCKDCVNNGELDVDQDTGHDCGAVGLKSSSESDNNQDSASLCGSGNLNQSVEEKCSAAEKTSESVSSSMPLVKQLRKETSLKFLLESSKCGDNDVGQQSNQIKFAHAVSEGPEVSITQEANKSSHVDNLLYSSEMESGIITFNFDSSKHSVSNKDESHENDIEQPLKSDNKPIHDDGISDKHLVVTSHVKRGEGGESSFSIPSDVVTYSGRIPFSGSISLRSDSSTTSTRSFAFPVLQNEWNCSPVRMAKADRKYNRKHRGWIMGFLCCRF